MFHFFLTNRQPSSKNHLFGFEEPTSSTTRLPQKLGHSFLPTRKDGASEVVRRAAARAWPKKQPRRVLGRSQWSAFFFGKNQGGRSDLLCSLVEKTPCRYELFKGYFIPSSHESRSIKTTHWVVQHLCQRSQATGDSSGRSSSWLPISKASKGAFSGVWWWIDEACWGVLMCFPFKQLKILALSF